MPIIIEFHTKYILNSWSMLFNPVKVSLMAFAVLFKILSTHCEARAPNHQNPLIRFKSEAEARASLKIANNRNIFFVKKQHNLRLFLHRWEFWFEGLLHLLKLWKLSYDYSCTENPRIFCLITSNHESYICKFPFLWACLLFYSPDFIKF